MSVSEEGGRNRCYRKLSKGNWEPVSPKDAEQDTRFRKFRDFPNSWEPQPQMAPKYPKQRKGFFLPQAPAGKWEVENRKGKLGLFCSDWPRYPAEHLSQEPRWK